MHSFTPVYTGIARPWHIGTLYEHDTRLAHLLLKALRAEHGLVVGDNEPYAVREGSDYAIPVHGAARGLIHTGIEIRQDLITEEAGQREWAERLARIFNALETAATRNQRERVSASHSPPPIMKPPETRDSRRVRFSDSTARARPASSA